MQQGAAGLQIMAKGMKILFQVLWKTSVGFLDLTTFLSCPRAFAWAVCFARNMQFYLLASNRSNQL